MTLRTFITLFQIVVVIIIIIINELLLLLLSLHLLSLPSLREQDGWALLGEPSKFVTLSSLRFKKASLSRCHHGDIMTI